MGAKARDRTARVRADRCEQVSRKRPLKGTAKVGEPDKFSGRKGDGKTAAATLALECEAFIDSVHEYMLLNDVPEEGMAGLAASYLTGQARTTYGAYRAAAKTQGKSVDWDFFVSTLRTAYVPRAQVADDLQAYFSHGFLKKAIQAAKEHRDKDLRIDDLLSAHKVSLQEAVRHGFADQLNDLVQCQLFLAALPDCLRAVVKLNEANEAHISWLHLERQVRQREMQLQAAWHTMLEAEPVKRAKVEAPAPAPAKKPFKFGKGSGAGSASGSGSQPATGTAEEAKGPKPGDKCNACGQLGHWAKGCPNKKKQGKGK
jgi:hypothetical protein